MFKYELGKNARDQVTGFCGIIIGRADYLTGCSQYALQPTTQDGKWEDSRWFDEHRIYVSKKEPIVLSADPTKGADASKPNLNRRKI